MYIRNRIASLILALLVATPAMASYGIYVGRNLTSDGSVFLGGSGDEVSSHWLEIVPASEHAADDTVQVGVDASAFLPGEFTRIPQAAHTARYITMNYSEYEGFPPPLTNGGLNEYGVAARDIWMDSRAELVAMTPRPQHGPNYSDLSRFVMERAHSAEEAVTIVGELIDRYGYSSYGGNSHMFADAHEGWVLLDFAGGQGLWVARRLGPDEVVMFYPGYIGDLPADFASNPDYRASANFIDFAAQQGWFDPTADEPFNVTAVYGRPEVREPRREIPQEIRADAPIDLRYMLNKVRDPRVSKDATGYGQVAHLREDSRPALRTLWVAPTGSVTAPFLPYRMAVTDVPAEFAKHRYLTKGEATRYVTRDWQIREASLFAGRLFKRLMYYTCDRPAEFLPEVTLALTAFEDRLLARQATVDATAATLLDAGKPLLAERYLNDDTAANGRQALDLGQALLASIEQRTTLQYGAREPSGEPMSRLDYQMVKCLP